MRAAKVLSNIFDDDKNLTEDDQASDNETVSSCLSEKEDDSDFESEYEDADFIGATVLANPCTSTASNPTTSSKQIKQILFSYDIL